MAELTPVSGCISHLFDGLRRHAAQDKWHPNSMGGESRCDLRLVIEQ